MDDQEILTLLKDLEHKIKKSTRRSWFNRNIGLISFIGVSITFVGYLATTIVGGITLASSNKNSTDALNISKKQFSHIITQDSLKSIVDSIASIRQDRINKHQDSLNKQQLLSYQGQTKIAGEQLIYFKRQTAIADTQLKNAQIIYQQQLNENRPTFLVATFTIDSNMHKPNVTIKFNLYNTGKRGAILKRMTAYFWNPKHTIIGCVPIPISDELILPTTPYNTNMEVGNEVSLELNDLLMFQVYYEDKLDKGILRFRYFGKVSNLKPLEFVDIDLEAKSKYLKLLTQNESQYKDKYLDY